MIPKIKPSYTVSSLETLHIISTPLRLELLEEITQANARGETLTAKQLAEKLGTTLHKLYYHLALLDKHGLIQIGETRLVSGIVEKHYAVTAWKIEIAEGLLTPGPLAGAGKLPPALKLFDNYARLTRENFSALLAAVGTEKEQKARLSGHRGLLTHERVRLTQEQADAFSARLFALTEEFNSHKDQPAEEGSITFTLFTVMIPNVVEAARTATQEADE